VYIFFSQILLIILKINYFINILLSTIFLKIIIVFTKKAISANIM